MTIAAGRTDKSAVIQRDTIGLRLANRQTFGFDYQRLILALLVLVWHSFAVVNPVNDFVWYKFGMRAVLPLFFALSGFLVASSMDRLNDLPTFLLMRVLRLLPALVVETLLSAFVLGPLLTTLSLVAYFTDPEFRGYLLNIVGWVHFYLPGVFKDHPVTWVNRSLWTIPFELECYIAIAGLYLVGAFKRTPLLLVVLVAYTALCAYFYRNYQIALNLLVPGRLLVAYFIAGNIIYKIRDRLPAGPVLAGVMLAISLAFLTYDWSMWLSPLPVAYASALLGCTKPKRIPVIFDGDYSYGMYLYAAPIQQTIYTLLGPAQSIWENAAVSTVVTALFAAFSWHVIEKPAVALKQRLKRRKLSAEPTGTDAPPLTATTSPAMETP